MKKEDVYTEISKLFELLKVLEKDQAAAREAVRIALQNKNISEIRRLSNIIRDNRRKPDGLRELNAKIWKLEQSYWFSILKDK